jgi:hypothetical protein
MGSNNQNCHCPRNKILIGLWINKRGDSVSTQGIFSMTGHPFGIFQSAIFWLLISDFLLLISYVWFLTSYFKLSQTGMSMLLLFLFGIWRLTSYFWLSSHPPTPFKGGICYFILLPGATGCKNLGVKLILPAHSKFPFSDVCQMTIPNSWAK